MQIKQRPPESMDVVKATPLPFTVPVDIISRGFQLGLLVLAVWAVVLCAKGGSGTPPLIWGLVALFLAFALYLQFHSSGLVLEAGGIRYTSLFLRTRRLPWNTLASVATGIDHFNESGAAIVGLNTVDVSTAPYMMLFQCNDGQPHLLLNIKPYKMSGLRTLVHFILHQAPQAEVDKTTRDIIQGIVPPPYNPHRTLPKG